jgi:plasmid stability protein
MRNVTITLEEEVARWARIRAAERDTSVSRLVGEILRERMETEQRYLTAQDAFFSVQPRPLRREATPYPRRDELHDRRGLR